jgi:hypothetical protein
LHLFIVPFWITAVVSYSTTLAALLSRDRRAIAIAACTAFSITVWLFSYFFCRDWTCGGPRLPQIMAWRWLAEDIVTIAVCLACVRRAQRYWVLWAASIALLYLATDLMGALVPRVTPWAYRSAGIVWIYALNATVLIGVWPRLRARLSPSPA